MEECTLPDLPYAYNALEPYIDEQTMRIHHTKHHQTYIDKLNAALATLPDFRAKVKGVEELIGDLNAVPESIRGAVRNHGGGHANHTFFWKIMAGERQGADGEIASALNKKFGSYDKFREAFSSSAAGVFGSGWCWLALNKGELELLTTPNQDSPVSQGKTPVLGLDVWEHSYYILYQNRRPEYIAAWWNVVNWQKVEENYKAALKN